MDYRRMNDICYIRIDRGEEIIEKLLEACKTEGIKSAIFSGIGGCSKAELQTFIPEIGSFETETIEGMLELNTKWPSVILSRLQSFIQQKLSCDRL